MWGEQPTGYLIDDLRLINHRNHKGNHMADSFADLMPSRFYKTEDVAEAPIVLTIKGITKEEVTFQGKAPEKLTIVHFNETDRQMIAKTTVLNTLKDLFGTPSACSGKAVELFKDKTTFGGKKVDCLRLRAPSGDQGPAF